MTTEISEPLTADEDKMMTFLATDMKAGAIATAMGYEVSTIHHRFKTIEKKLGVKSRTAAMHAWTMLQPRHLVRQRPRRCRRIVAIKDSSGARAYAVCDGTEPCESDQHITIK